MGKRRFFVHSLFQFGIRCRDPGFPSAGPSGGGIRPKRAKKTPFPDDFPIAVFPLFYKEFGRFDTPRDNVSPPPKKEPRGEKTAAGRLVSYAQKKARRVVHLVYFSARFFYPCTFCTNRVLGAFFTPPGAFSSFRDP